MPTSKELNNDWSAESTWGAEGLDISLLSEGNEAKGEVPQTNGQINIRQYLTGDGCDLEPGEASASPEQISTTKWATDGVTMTLSLSGESELIEEHEENLVEAVEGALPDGWERVN
jgi:hypothetical protein